MSLPGPVLTRCRHTLPAFRHAGPGISFSSGRSPAQPRTSLGKEGLTEHRHQISPRHTVRVVVGGEAQPQPGLVQGNDSDRPEG